MANPSSSMNGTEDFLATDINALSSVNQSMEFDGSDSLSTYNLRLLSSNGTVEQIHIFPEMVSAFGLSGGSLFTNALCTADYTSNGINIKGKKRKSISDCDGLPPKSPKIQIFEDNEQNNVSHTSFKGEGERDVKKQNNKLLHCPCPTKSNVKETKEISKDDADPKEAYIHVRAKRGKATNSHSLAERVRREKISERMRILQDLVPGCNKITGKAVMLDEIINYVQSLQQQVQFLSMKLSAVNPELNFDIEQIFSKVARDRTAFLGLSPGFSTSYAHCHGTRQIPSEMLMATTISQLSSMAQIENIWDEEIQNAVEMTFTPPQHINAYGFRGKDSKVG